MTIIIRNCLIAINNVHRQTGFYYTNTLRHQHIERARKQFIELSNDYNLQASRGVRPANRSLIGRRRNLTCRLNLPKRPTLSLTLSKLTVGSIVNQNLRQDSIYSTRSRARLSLGIQVMNILAYRPASPLGLMCKVSTYIPSELNLCHPPRLWRKTPVKNTYPQQNKSTQTSTIL